PVGAVLNFTAPLLPSAALKPAGRPTDFTEAVLIHRSMRAIDERGRRYGRLFVLDEAGSTSGRAAKWLCRCDCGNLSTVIGSHLRRGWTTSCGCRQREAVAMSNVSNPRGRWQKQRASEGRA